MRYWIGVVSWEHVQRGVAGGFCQLCHGKNGPLKKMQPGDWLIYYSPNNAMGESGTCQQFTAIGQIAEGEPYLFRMSDDFVPYRRDVHYLPCQSTPIRPMINDLAFIRDKQRWGYAFRYGQVEISREDFELIAGAMLDSIPDSRDTPPGHGTTLSLF
ncbi:EVE domain-containing protein [Parachitinimonas caeni]|uniref:UPF0310 protein PZA18_14055 n=1 Tax=Parachitinimonas caeni TaxID=3031301 RepID=A0ABT7DYM5_9NEIS|nr:EVE domain-containing protein [Parachitinimonas caeni]MDK2125175.1 EVE domain-containing protein [Parachitinimonas caeni]